MARVAEDLGVGWSFANDAVLTETRRVLIDAPDRLDGITTIGVDGHVWRHLHRGDAYVTVTIDLSPIRCGTGPARLLDMARGRSTRAFPAWLAARHKVWRDAVEVVAMDGFTGYKTAAAHELPQAVTVMDPLHVIRSAGDTVDEVRRRRQQELHDRRGRTGDPLFWARRLLHTGTDLLTDRQRAGLNDLFIDDERCEVEATWGIYQHMIAAYRNPTDVPVSRR